MFLGSDIAIRTMNRRAKVINLQEKIKNLEWKLNEKDDELEKLTIKKLQIVKEKDSSAR